MPVASNQNYTQLVQIQQNLIATLKAETQAQMINGAKPSYSLDGESYSWSEWVTAMTEAIEKHNGLIQNAAGPYQFVSQRRA